MHKLVATTGIVALAGLPWAGRPAVAQETPNEVVVHRFSGNTMVDGAAPSGRISIDAAGNVYGTTTGTGSDLSGNVYQLSTGAGGKLALTSLHYFPASSRTDAVYPVSGVTLSPDGALYGVTQDGGGTNSGAAYRLAPPAAGQAQWAESILYNFPPYPAPNEPPAAPTVGPNNVLYGVAYGGMSGNGDVYELLPPTQQGSAWTFVSLYDFPADGKRGALPTASLLLGPKGTLYGTTFAGGIDKKGVVFKLVPPTAGATGWTEHVLHSFTGREDGGEPLGALIIDDAGNLYGTATVGGSVAGDGVVFELSPPAAGTAEWTESVLHSFAGGSDGIYPDAGLYRSRAGSLYGTTVGGGSASKGTVFELTQPAAGQTSWVETVFSFGTTGPNNPSSNLVRFGKVLIGTTRNGGIVPASSGTVFAIGAGSTEARR